MNETGKPTQVDDLPDDVANALAQDALTDDFLARPLNERLGYLGWIGREKTGTTRAERIAIMIDELKSDATPLNLAYEGPADG